MSRHFCVPLQDKAATFPDWYCESCDEWASQQGDDCDTGHDLIVTDRSKELARVAKRWHETRNRERELAAQVYELIQLAHGMGTPITAHDVAICMILVKASRSKVSAHADNYRDIAGYAEIGERLR